MPDSKRLDVLKRLTAHLESVVSDETDYVLKGRVGRGKIRYGREMPLPFVAILEAPRQDDGLPAAEQGVKRSEDWLLLVQGWVEDDQEHPTDPAYELCAVVEKQLSRIIDMGRHGQPAYPDEYLLGKREDGTPRILGLSLAPPVVRPPQEGVSDKAFFYLPLTVKFAVDIREPFSAG